MQRSLVGSEMCIRDSPGGVLVDGDVDEELLGQPVVVVELHHSWEPGGQGRPAGAGRLLVDHVSGLALVGGLRVLVSFIGAGVGSGSAGE